MSDKIRTIALIIVIVLGLGVAYYFLDYKEEEVVITREELTQKLFYLKSNQDLNEIIDQTGCVIKTQEQYGHFVLRYQNYMENEMKMVFVKALSETSTVEIEFLDEKNIKQSFVVNGSVKRK